VRGVGLLLPIYVGIAFVELGHEVGRDLLWLPELGGEPHSARNVFDHHRGLDCRFDAAADGEHTMLPEEDGG